MNKWKILLPLAIITSLIVFALTKDVFYLGMSFIINILVIFFVSFVMVLMIKRMKKPVEDLKSEIQNLRTPSPYVNTNKPNRVAKIHKAPSHTDPKVYVPENVRKEIDILNNNIKDINGEIEELKRDAENSRVSHEEYKQTMVYLEGRKQELSNQLKEIEARYR